MTTAYDLYTVLKDIFFILEDGDRRFFQAYDLTVTRFYAMFHLKQQPGLNLRELADCMLCDKSNVTRVIKGLERDNIVYRQPHESDGRAYRLFLTEAGAALLHTVESQHAQHNAQRFNDIVAADQTASLTNTLRHVAGILHGRLHQ